MPLYDIQCEAGHRSERFIPLENFSDPIVCDCGRSARRSISAPMFSVDNTGYTCPITGDWIGSKTAHKENLAKHGCRVLESGETDQARRVRQEQDQKLDKAIEDTVERTIESWDSGKKEALHNELVNGKLDLTVERL